MVYTVLSIVGMLLSTIYLIVDYFKMEHNRHLCADYCIPYRHEMADSETCVCYDDRHLEIVSVEEME
jgi:hypothetical protein